MPSDFNAVIQQLSLQIQLDADATVLATLPPILPRDQLDSVLVYLVSNTAVSQAGEFITLEVYGCNQPPATADEARAGRTVQALTTIPLMPQGVLSADSILYGVQVSIPTIFVPDPQTRHLAAVLVGADNANLFGSLYFKVFRPLTKLDDVNRKN